MIVSMDPFSCSPPPNDSFLSYLRFIFLSPCPQRLLISAIDLLFLLTLLLSSLQKLFSRLFRKNRNRDHPNTHQEPLLPKPDQDAPIQTTTSPRFYFTLAVSVVLAVAYAVLLVLCTVKLTTSQQRVAELVFLISQLLATSASVAVVAHERRFLAYTHPLSLRLFWVSSFAVAALFSASSIIKLTAAGDQILVDDVIALVSLPLYLLLLYVALTGSTGVSPVVNQAPSRSVSSRYDHVTPYATASLISRATWSWLNPLLTKGYKSPLKIDDVPNVAPNHDAERLSRLFEANWPPLATKSDHPVRTTLLRCFWVELLVTAALAVVKLLVMYVGPTLIQSFVDFASSENGRDLLQGYKLCAMLLASKFLEVLSSHHFNFVSGNLGMSIRSMLITALYRKGLKLSCSSRQQHGVGMIVNYMAVDAQQLGDVTMQLHFLWLMPMQVLVGMALLYFYLGLSTVAVVVGVVLTMGMVTWLSKKSNIYQFLLMGMRDKRMKAMNEMLNYMRVIKYQVHV